jgi:hypothetical protein
MSAGLVVAERAVERPAGPSVPWHAQSAGDRFLDQIAETDRALAVGIRRISAPIMARATRTKAHTFRREMLIDVRREWESLPTFSRLGLVVDADQRSLRISDCRATTVSFAFDDWPEGHGEHGLGIIIIRLTIAPHDIGVKTERLAVISRHALCRRFQRGVSRSDESVIEDLQRLVIAREEVGHSDEFECSTPSGSWIGGSGAVPKQSEPITAIRTFI